MSLLSTSLTPSPRSRETLVIIQSTLATPSCLPFVHAIISAGLTWRAATIVCVCLLHAPETVLAGMAGEELVRVFDWTGEVPGYGGKEEEEDGRGGLLRKVCKAVDDAPDGPVLLVVDSPDTLCEDVGSPSKAYSILKTWHTAISKRTAPSRIVLPLPSRSSLLPILITPAFSQTLVKLTLHPPSLIHHLSTEYLTLPPPHSPPTKFWPIFTGLATRGEGESLVWGTAGSGWSAEVVVEVVMRSASGKKTVERSLEGWRKNAVCKLEELETLRDVWNRNSGSRQQQSQNTPDPTHNLPFNLSLTEAQQHSRAQVPLPYVHDGRIKPNSSTGDAAIYYDPDSADDIDEDDPDEDLDI
ncbi:hypothetical protein JB92DRAFT_3066724 [Gautieria morchelliformis]|nr:hypothetical protein JB92DRAFT_3066724 [Gautieria morchelliformis]